MRIDMTGTSAGPRHTLRVGDHVYQRVNPWLGGMVTRSDEVSFSITYDGPERMADGTRPRFTYPARRSSDFLVGQSRTSPWE